MKLEIKEEFLNRENRLLETFIFLLSDRYSDRRSQISSKENSYVLMYYTKDQLIKSLERFSQYLEKDEKFIPIRTDIHEIVVNNKYEPYSYHFIITFFKEVIWWDFEKTYQVEKFITSTRDNTWLLKRFFINFLEMFTNIDDLKKKFLKTVEMNDKNILYTYNREKSFMNYLIFESFPVKHNKKTETKLEGINAYLLDWRVFSLKKYSFSKIENLKKPYYFEDLENIMRLNNVNNLFL